MEEIFDNFTRINRLCYWLNKNTKLSSTIIFDGLEKEYMIIIQNMNKENIYTYNIDLQKSEKIILFEMNIVLNVLQTLKDNNGERR